MFVPVSISARSLPIPAARRAPSTSVSPSPRLSAFGSVATMALEQARAAAIAARVDPLDAAAGPAEPPRPAAPRQARPRADGTLAFAAHPDDSSAFGSILAPAAVASLVGGAIEDLAPIHASTGITPEFRWIIASPASTAPVSHAEEVSGFAEAYFIALTAANRGGSAAERRGMAWWLAISRSTIVHYLALTPVNLVSSQRAVVDFGANFTPANSTTDSAAARAGFTVENPALAAKYALGALVASACCVVSTGHHWLSDAPGSHRAVAKSLNKQLDPSAGLAGKFGISAANWEDIVFHKATHPLVDAVFRTVVTSPDFAARLRTAGVGSAAARLPLKSDQESALSASATLIAEVQALAPALSVAISDELLRTYDEHLQAAMARNADPTLMTRAQWAAAPYAKRDAVISEYLSRFAPQIAMAAGVYSTYVQMQGTGLSTSATVTQSFFIRKCRDSHAAQTSLGAAHVREALSHASRRAQRGQLTGLAIGEVDAPQGPDMPEDPANATMREIVAAAISRR